MLIRPTAATPGIRSRHAQYGTIGLLDSDIQTNFSVNANPLVNFAQTTNASVAFDRNQNVYVLTSSHDAASANGVLDLMRWDFSSATPTPQTFTTPAYDSFSAVDNITTINPIYRWQGVNGATPTLAVNDNAASYTDLSTGATNTDPYSGNVYVAWETNDAEPKNFGAYNPNTIKLMASSDLGQDFTYQAYLNGTANAAHANGNLYDQPQIAISQGTPGTPTTGSNLTSASVSGGQVTVVYDNAGPGGGSAVAPYYDEVFSQASDTGGTDEHFNRASDVPIANTTVGSTTTPAMPAVTNIPINVAINDANFTSLQNLTLSLSLQLPILANTSASLISPTGTSVTLWNYATDNTGTATNFPGTITGANLGASTQTIPGLTNPVLPYYIGTTLDSTAFRSLSVNGAAPHGAFPALWQSPERIRGLVHHGSQRPMDAENHR